MASSANARLLKTTKFPPEFNQKVDLQKVNFQVIKKSVFPPFPSQPHTQVSSKKALLTLLRGTDG